MKIVCLTWRESAASSRPSRSKIPLSRSATKKATRKLASTCELCPNWKISITSPPSRLALTQRQDLYQARCLLRTGSGAGGPIDVPTAGANTDLLVRGVVKSITVVVSRAYTGAKSRKFCSRT